MTPEEQQIAIIEALGWTEVTMALPFLLEFPEDARPILCGFHPKTRKWGPCPDCLNDLNAMHEAEKVLTDGQYDIFEQELAKIVGFRCHDEWPAPTGLRLVISATASQRLEAILKALNLWK